MRKLCFILLIGSSLLSVSCSREKANLSGKFVGKDSTTLYLERILPAYNEVVDTAVTDEKGNFKFNVKLPNGEVTMFNLIYGEQSIPLLIAPREKVKINSVGNIARNYTVSGSPESARLKELVVHMTNSSIEIDSILKKYVETTDTAELRLLALSYNKAYIKAKQGHVTFIVEEPGTLSSLYALYQRLPNDEVLATGEQDIIYYRLVADSTAAEHPNSPYVKALQREIERAEQTERTIGILSQKYDEASTIEFPDINLKDMYDVDHRLSDNLGSVILLDFWSVLSENVEMYNAELKRVYELFHQRGLEIYQVSVDNEASKPLWVRVVQKQSLPWISVGEFSEANRAARTYNVQEVPANFLISREGDIIGKDLTGDALLRKIEEIL